jgi:hypothetical protein
MLVLPLVGLRSPQLVNGRDNASPDTSTLYVAPAQHVISSLSGEHTRVCAVLFRE